MPFVMNAVKASDCNILEQDFEVAPRIKISIPISNQELEQELKAIKGVIIKA